ncbi:MAG: hypothetical protein HQL51_03845, partial [Magnetococcales bacterium]|nr:hypothetical protein [Magnetococcales bacterium]
MSHLFEPTIVAEGRGRGAARAWLLLGLVAFALSCLFALALVALRLPWHPPLPLGGVMFRTALVLHVALSVGVWFFSMGAAAWSLALAGRWPPLQWVGFALGAAGALSMLLSPLVEEAVPLMNNYLPVLRGGVFLSGLGLFGGGTALAALLPLLAGRSGRWPPADGEESARLGLTAAALAYGAALGCIAWSASVLPWEGWDARWFEHLFWAGGHLFQFVHTLFLLAAWLVLAAAGGVALRLSPRGAALIFAGTLAPLLLAPMGFDVFEDSGRYRTVFTELMRFGTWPASLPLAWILMRDGWRAPRVSLFSEAGAARATLALSMGLFYGGLLLGAGIRGDNLTVTAHYHATVGAVTLAWMGWSWRLLSRWGDAPPPGRRRFLQPWIYGLGGLLLAVGLFWAGLLDSPRKSVHGPGGFPLPMGPLLLVTLGGGMALLGGLLHAALALPLAAG